MAQLMGTWQIISLVLALILLAFACRKEYRRYNKKNVVLRITATALAIVSLLSMGFDIPYTHTVIARGTAAIITTGYSKDSIKHFTDAEKKQVPIYTFEDFLASGNINYKKFDVFGYGLTKDELSQLDNTPIIFHPQNIGTGVISAHWKQDLQTGEPLHMQGIFNNAEGAPVKLVLNGFNTPLDSTIIQPASQEPFDLVTIPKQLGSAVFNITASANSKSIETEPIPVNIRPTGSLRVLMLASAPGFENRFLKNWLSDNGFEVAIRNTTSKKKYNQSFLNTRQENLTQITKPALGGFDVLICDAAEFSALSRDEQHAIQSKVEDGMGLILKADTTAPASAFYASNFQVYSPGAEPTGQIAIRLADGNMLHNLDGAQSPAIRSTGATQPLATDSSSSEIFATSFTYGAGKIAVTTLNNTYSWMLTGDKNDYYALWSMIFSKVSKNKSTRLTLNYAPVFPIVNQPVHITFESPSSPRLVINESPVYLAQQAGLYYRWNGTYWPTRAGWQTTASQNDTATFYVFDYANWKYARAEETIAATKQYADDNNRSPAENIIERQQVAFPKIYFVILFLICCTFLWMEKKFNG